MRRYSCGFAVIICKDTFWGTLFNLTQLVGKLESNETRKVPSRSSTRVNFRVCTRTRP